jgi:hypothetical protein
MTNKTILVFGSYPNKMYNFCSNHEKNTIKIGLITQYQYIAEVIWYDNYGYSDKHNIFFYILLGKQKKSL